VDGSTFRVPFRGSWVAGSGVPMERNGCVPDVEAENPPDQDSAPSYRQLDTAVEVLGKQWAK
jgi:tricorn protease